MCLICVFLSIFSNKLSVPSGLFQTWYHEISSLSTRAAGFLCYFASAITCLTSCQAMPPSRSCANACWLLLILHCFLPGYLHLLQMPSAHYSTFFNATSRGIFFTLLYCIKAMTPYAAAPAATIFT